MEQSWRWYGPEDPVSLNDIRQAGATAVVTALHHIANGEVWPEAEIQARKAQIEAKGLRWNVVESVPVHEEIKTRSGQVELWIANYQQTLINLSRCGIHTVCYNFMPVLDWTRTDLDYELPDGSKALRFDQDAFAAFDLFLLQRPGAVDDYTEEEQQRARQYLQQASQAQRDRLIQTIIAGLPGAEEHYTLEDFRHQLARYTDIDKGRLREHLLHFLNALMPICEAKGIRLAIHPDDPPRPLFGLPRIVSTLDDIEWLTQAVPQLNNGLTFCTGSYGVRSDNDLLVMVKRFADRIYFTHLRSTQREHNPLSFHEAAHLTGDVDMVGIVMEILREEHRRALSGREDLIAMRPDHGHQILDDLHKKTNPGYSAIGRLKGLAEIRGLELALKRSFFSAS